MRTRLLTLGLLLLAAASTLKAELFPCRPCAGVRTNDPTGFAHALAAGNDLPEEAVVFVGWSVDLEVAGPDQRAASVNASGSTPLITTLFHTPTPITGHMDELQVELERLAELAGSAPSGTYFQIVWQPEPESPAPPPVEDYAFLLKLATVTINGAQSEASILTAPLPPSSAWISALFQQEISAYVDAIALPPASSDVHQEVLAKIAELGWGSAVVLDALPAPAEPAEALALAAQMSEVGFHAVLFRDADTSLAAPLRLLAQEFTGDVSLDPYSRPSLPADAWSFVRGDDLSLRVVVRAPVAGPADELLVQFSDTQLRRPSRIDLHSGEVIRLSAVSRSASGLNVRVADPDSVTVLRLERLTAEELEGITGLTTELTVTDERQIPVEEILRRLQAVEDAQKRRIETYSALNTTHLRFQAGTGANSFEATFRGPFFFRRDQGFDWVWQEFLVNGVNWRGKTIPEIPLIQPEKATTLPVEITFSKEYSYELRGSGEAQGRACWVIDFRPAVEVEAGATLYQGTVWVDQQMFARVKTRAVQLGLAGDVLSNEETIFFSPIDTQGQAADWSANSFFLPLRLVGQQIWSVLSNTVVVEREILLNEIAINPENFEEQREAMLASEYTMLRDTEQGLRYLETDEETGTRKVKETLDRKRRFLVGGVFFDDSQDFPIPLAGINWLWFDLKESGTQANVFFAGALLNVAVTNPSLHGSRFDLGFDAFALAIAGTDSVFRNGVEIDREDVDVMRPSINFKIGHPLGSFTKVDLQYELRWVNFSKADGTADEFIVPADHLRHSVTLRTRYNRKGYRLRATGTHSLRSNWDPWGFPANPDFQVDHDEFTRWGASIGKTWHLPKFFKFGAEVEYVDGVNLDRFSKYEFGFFSDVRVRGFQSDKVRAEQALATHLTYGFNLSNLLRLELAGDVAWANDEASGLDQELLAGLGIGGTIVGPWRTLINLDVGVPVEGPDDGFSAFFAILKLLK